MQIIAKCPSLIRKSPFHSFCDITECLTSPSSAPKSTPIITNWSQIVKNAPSILSPTPKTCRHSLTEISQCISSLIHHLSSLLWIDPNLSQLISNHRKSPQPRSEVPQLVTKKFQLPLPLAYKLIRDAKVHRISIKACPLSSKGHITSPKVASNPRYRTRVALKTKICKSYPSGCLG